VCVFFIFKLTKSLSWIKKMTINFLSDEQAFYSLATWALEMIYVPRWDQMLGHCGVFGQDT
jgi:hypothetical protein